MIDRIIHPAQLGGFAVLLFGIFDTLDVFWYWKLLSFVCGKEVFAAKHCACCG
jgi:hypothetical protein